MLLTTIPFDKGWRAYVDGKKVPITSFKDAFVSVPITRGEHTIEFVYLPEGFLLGLGLFFGCTTLFVLYIWVSNRYSQSQIATPKKKRARKKATDI